MKTGTPNHPKTKRLAKELKIPLYQAIGALESIWHMTADFCPDGNIGKFTDQEIADHLEWQGDPSALIEALAKTGWLDNDDADRYVIHDWLDHCPEFIKERLWKRKQRAAKSNKIKTYGDSAADITGHETTCPPLVHQCPSIPSPSNPNPSNSKPPPPPTDGQGPDRMEVEEVSWESLKSILQALGMGDAKSALSQAKKAGLTPAAVQAIVAHFQATPGVWDIGGLHYRISNATRGAAPSDNWPTVKQAANGSKSLPEYSGRRRSKPVEATA